MARLGITPELVLDLVARHPDDHAVLGALRAYGIRSAADAQARYASPRLPSQRVPPSVRLVQITKADLGARPLVSLLVTQRPIVRGLARLVNALPFLGRHAGVFSCPSLRRTDRHVHLPSQSGWTAARHSQRIRRHAD
jgi:hypothetical protein